MSWLRFFRRKRSQAELLEEIDVYLAEEIAENVARGMSPEEARRRARIKLGNPQRVGESLWQQNTITAVDNLWRDLKYAARTLARARGFALTATLVMALGIGATTALFTVVRSVLLNPLPYPNSARLVELSEDQGNTYQQYHYMPVSAGSFAEWQHAVGSAAQMALIGPWRSYNVSANGAQLPESANAGWVSWNLFRVLGVAPALGRDFLASDDQPSAQSTVILSYSFWRRRFAGDPAVIGKAVWLDARPYTVIGVMPPSFAYPSAKTQLWTAASHEAPPSLMSTFEDHEFNVIARLLPGNTLTHLVSQLDTVQKRIKLSHPDPSVTSMVVGRTLLDATVENYETPLYVLLAATVCVLLIACLNVANLLVARSAARQKDLAIRTALGGSRWRLIREHLSESFVVSVAGGALGLLLAWAALAWLLHSHLDIARSKEIHLDPLTLVFVTGISTLSGLVAGLVPSYGLHTGQLLETLQSSSRLRSGGRNRARLRKALLTAEVSLTVILLLGAGLLLKSYQRLRSIDLGCAIDNVLTMSFDLPALRYEQPPRRIAFFDQLLARVRTLPGVNAAGLATAVPGQGWDGDNNVSIVEHPPLPKGASIDLLRRSVDPGYFAAIQIPLLRGRYFRDEERLDQARIAIISESTAKEFFPGEDPIGRHLKIDEGTGGGPYEIVGIVRNTRWMVSQPERPTYYLPLFNGDYNEVTLVVRSGSNVESLALPVQKIFGQLDPDLPLADILTMQQSISQSVVQDQFNSTLILAFAIIALILAAVGLYGMLSYLVTQRAGELGIRIALGAQRGEVLRLTLTDGLTPAILGLALGLAGGAAMVQELRAMLYGMSPFDWNVFSAVVIVCAFIAALACAVPAWRASHLDPAQTLRSE
jgi:predicted permease